MFIYIYIYIYIYTHTHIYIACNECNMYRKFKNPKYHILSIKHWFFLLFVACASVMTKKYKRKNLLRS